MTDFQRLHDLPLDLARRVKFGAAILGMPGQRRHLFRWLRSAGPEYLLEEPSPWMTFDAIQVLDDHLRPGMRVFEYGSGGSTLFWVKKEANVVSVEHDPLWFGSVRDRLASSSAVDYRLVEPEAGVLTSDGAPGDPLAYASDDERFRGFSNPGHDELWNDHSSHVPVCKKYWDDPFVRHGYRHDERYLGWASGWDDDGPGWNGRRNDGRDSY